MGIVNAVAVHEAVVAWAGSGFGVARFERGEPVACHAGPRGGVMVYPSVERAERAMVRGGVAWRPFRRRMDADAIEVSNVVRGGGATSGDDPRALPKGSP